MLTVGRITKLFGVKGEVVINLYDTLPDSFNWEEQPFFTRVEELVVPLFCDSFARRGQRSAVVAFADIDNEKRAEMILDHELMLEVGESDSDEFYFDDLIGLRVIDGKNSEYGKVIEVYDLPASVVIEIQLKTGKTVMVPFIDIYINDVTKEHILIERIEEFL